MIAEIETDKATMEVEAVDEGTLGKILIAAGTEHVAVNTAIAVLLEEGEDIRIDKIFPSLPPKFEQKQKPKAEKVEPSKAEAARVIGCESPNPAPAPERTGL